MRPFNTGHEELVHDISYDFYGRRLVTCSSDQHIKVFEKNNETQSWDLSDSWKAHDSSIVRVIWASPEFGQILASCSHDGTVKIWEEDVREPINSGKRWKRVATFSDFDGPIYDVAFCPSHHGLKIGTIGSDGVVRILEAMDPNSLRNWSSVQEIPLLAETPSWNLQSAFALEWAPSKFGNEMFVVSSLDQGFIYQRNDNGKYFCVATLPEHQGLIRDVAWAASMGRTYQLIATACKDGHVRIFKVTNANGGNSTFLPNHSSSFSLSTNLIIELVSKFDEHSGEVWRVSWNLTGTVLSSAGDDGKVRLWKASYSNEFQCMAVISAEQPNL
ncbi:WD40 repeat-like protein [Nadsonia fulvescens var. elongata DSM 6958]|uniref:WD40 repeat-like protein n=1 Tax=Nadsonia fulvescens var. elongata DSM 6958 TaxID=857566 RepID=A0A1E3PK36_9ASCO|nr:WD40 repeat-like protein [Nadsonia fulvescens var. elongata DSM 6958]